MYNGPGIIKQLAHTKKNYRGKNIRGGRKCLFAQSRAYKHGYLPSAISWTSSPRFSYFSPVRSM